MAFGLVISEIARVDCGLSTFFIAHGSLTMATLALLGSEDQKRELLPGERAMQATKRGVHQA